MPSQAIASCCAAAAVGAVPSLFPRRSVVSLSLPPSPHHRGQLSVQALLKRNPKRLKHSAPPRFFKKSEVMLYVEMDPMGTETWRLAPIIKLIKEGAVGVIPTDTVYAIVCDLKSSSSIEQLRRIKDIKDKKPLSILCHSFRDIGTYTTGFPCGDSQGHRDIFRAVKRCLPGPYTFILPATKELPKQCIKSGLRTRYVSRKNVGVRMPNDPICQAILQNLDAPLVSTSVKWPSEDQWILDPVMIADTYEPQGLDFVVSGGIREAVPSTVVDMTGRYPTVIRQGKGPMLDWMVTEGEESGGQS